MAVSHGMVGFLVLSVFAAATMPFLLLSPRPARTAVEIASVSGARKTHRTFMPQQPWVVELAKKNGLHHILEEERESKRKGTATQHDPKGLTRVCCMVSFSPGTLGRGILTDWTAEEEYARNWLFDTPEKKTLHSVCSLQVRKVVAFVEPLVCHCPLRLSSDLWEPGRIEAGFFSNLAV